MSYSERDCLLALAAACRVAGKRLTVREYAELTQRDPTLPSHDTITRHLGSWRSAIRAAWRLA